MQDPAHHHPDWTDSEGFATPDAWRHLFIVAAVLATIILSTAALGLLIVAIPATVLLALIVLIVPIVLTLHEPTI